MHIASKDSKLTQLKSSVHADCKNPSTSQSTSPCDIQSLSGTGFNKPLQKSMSRAGFETVVGGRSGEHGQFCSSMFSSFVGSTPSGSLPTRGIPSVVVRGRSVVGKASLPPVLASEVGEPASWKKWASTG